MKRVALCSMCKEPFVQIARGEFYEWQNKHPICGACSCKLSENRHRHAAENMVKVGAQKRSSQRRAVETERKRAVSEGKNLVVFQGEGCKITLDHLDHEA